jgi:hypothetical protein
VRDLDAGRILNSNVKEQDVTVCDGLLWTRTWTIGFHKKRGIAWLAELLIIIWLYSPSRALFVFRNNNLFFGAGLSVQRPTPNLEDQVSVFMTPRDRVVQLYPQALGTNFSRLLRHAWVTVGLFFNSSHHTGRSRISSGSMLSDYGLDDRAIGVWSPAGAEDFSSILCVQTGSGVHPASCTMGTGSPFPGRKARLGRDADHSPPSCAEVVNE